MFAFIYYSVVNGSIEGVRRIRIPRIFVEYFDRAWLFSLHTDGSPGTMALLKCCGTCRYGIKCGVPAAGIFGKLVNSVSTLDADVGRISNPPAPQTRIPFMTSEQVNQADQVIITANNVLLFHVLL